MTTEQQERPEPTIEVEEMDIDGVLKRSAEIESVLADLMDRPVGGVRRDAVDSITPRNFADMWRYCEMMASSDLVPPAFKGKPANCWIAIECGLTLGLAPAQALQNIAVINGKPSLYGPIGLAIVRTHAEFGGIEEAWNPPLEELDGKNETFLTENLTAHCTIYRIRGDKIEVCSRSFSVADAKRANLWADKGTYAQYGPRMLQHRARWWAMQDLFGDALGGLPSAEEQAALAPQVDAAAAKLDRTSSLANRIRAKSGAISGRDSKPASKQADADASQEKAPTSGGPPMSYEDLIADIRKAPDGDALAECLTVINDWPNTEEKKAAGAAYKARYKEIKEGG